MEELRWIILGAGVVFILVIYLIGRNKNKEKSERKISAPEISDLPSINTDDDFSDEIAAVKAERAPYVSTDISQVELNQALIEEVSAGVDDGLVDALTYAHANKKLKADLPETSSESEAESFDDEEAAGEEDNFASSEAGNSQPEDDLVIMYVIAGEAFFTGDDLASFINKHQLKYGDMKLYHARDDQGGILFSMSNMIEPGYFEPEHLSEMQTPGVILFMQLSLVSDTVIGFRRMQYTAESLASELGGTLCDARRRILDDNDFDQMQQKAERFQN
jgi:cell division protein ZipA